MGIRLFWAEWSVSAPFSPAFRRWKRWNWGNRLQRRSKNSSPKIFLSMKVDFWKKFCQKEKNWEKKWLSCKINSAKNFHWTRCKNIAELMLSPNVFAEKTGKNLFLRSQKKGKSYFRYQSPSQFWPDREKKENIIIDYPLRKIFIETEEETIYGEEERNREGVIPSDSDKVSLSLIMIAMMEGFRI